jgi:hypothetical protein
VSYYHDDPTQEVNSSRSFLPGFLVLILLITGGGFFVKSTLAANIALSSGRAIEFGQSVSQAVACSGSQNVTVIPKSSFVNAANGSGTYYLSSITVGNIPTSCYGTNFKLSAFGPSSSTPLALFNSTSTEAVVYNNSGSFEVRDPSDGVTVSGGSGTFTVTFDSPVALSTSVSKVTIQSGGGVRALQLGEQGPGGGIIFYKASTPFTCGPTRATTCRYLEAAPDGWNTGQDPTRTWAPSGVGRTSAIAQETGIGWGYSNSLIVVALAGANTSNSAAALARSYTSVVSSVTYNDWFLPSKDELRELYLQKSLVGSFVNDWYFSSSDSTIDAGAFAFIHRFADGASALGGKVSTPYLRPIRAF